MSLSLLPLAAFSGFVIACVILFICWMLLQIQCISNWWKNFTKLERDANGNPINCAVLPSNNPL